jgi:hypothetical protein
LCSMLGVTANEGWTKEMTVGGGRAYQYVQWIELLWGVVKGSECGRVCSIDKSPVVGKAVRL